jgi:peptidoglycan/LPS O-acetylase OafA/YrhL
MSAGCLAALTIATWLLPDSFLLTDTLTGLGTMSLMVACTQRCRTNLAGQTGVVVMLLRVLEWKPLAVIGAMSYSLYLIHGPLINLTAMLLAWLCGPNSPVRIWLMPVVAIPAIWAAVRVFHQQIERPFMTTPRGAGEHQ